jgi:hypothetical protein
MWAELWCAAVIGDGPSSPTAFTRLIMLALGLLHLVSAIYPETRIGRRRTKGSYLPISTAWRIIFVLIALVMFSGALGILH